MIRDHYEKTDHLLITLHKNVWSTNVPSLQSEQIEKPNKGGKEVNVPFLLFATFKATVLAIKQLDVT